MSVALRNDIRPTLKEVCPHCGMKSWCGRMCANMEAVREAMGFRKPVERSRPERACITCGESLEGRHHWAKYCSEECRPS